MGGSLATLTEGFAGERAEQKARVRTDVLPRGTPTSPGPRMEALGGGIGDGRSKFGLKLHFGFFSKVLQHK